MMNKIEKSTAMKRVWEWKEKIYNEVKELDLEERFKIIHKMAREVDEKLILKK